METIKHCIIVGASSKLAQAVIDILLNDSPNYRIHAISQNPETNSHQYLSWHQCNYQESSIQNTCKGILNRHKDVSSIMIFNGQLHWGELLPEKRIQDLNSEYFQKIFTANTLIPMLFLKHLIPNISQTHECKIIVTSARVGSIQDNKLGGWYSYRSSKAALNMMMKNLAIETARKTQTIKLVLYHPGTTNTPLSEPFQKSVPKSKLFSTAQSAQYLLAVLNAQKFDGELSFVDWCGHTVEW
jgi:NAD(P)-dependent dehydrogenase (short-subunit alcohol dehydrogenase family)